MRTLLAILLLLACATARAEPPRFRPDPAWPLPLPNGWALGDVSGVAVDAADTIWIVHRPRTAPKAARAAPPILRLDQSGRVLAAWGGPGPGYDWFQSEHGITVDAAGNVWLGGNGPRDGQVLKFTAAGRFLLQIGHPATGAASNDTTRLGRPADIAVDLAANEIFVADGYANRRIIVFDATTGAYRRHWGAYGETPRDAPHPRQFGTPVHCAKLAHDGLLYVCDRTRNRIQVFDRLGTFLREFRIAPETPASGSAWDLALWPDAAQTLLLDADGQSQRIHLLRRTDGTPLAAFGTRGRAPGQFHALHSIAVDRAGRLYATEVTPARRIQRFLPATPP